MMTLQSWRQMVPKVLREQFMNSRLWQGYKEEWVWDLAIVDEDIIISTYKQLNEFQKEVLLELLNDLLLTPQLEEELVHALIRRLARPSRQCKQALQLFTDAGIIVAFQDPWRGLILWIPLPVFNNWRNMLHAPAFIQQVDSIPSNDNCRFEHVITLTVRFTMFIQLLNNTPLRFTKSGQLSKSSMKQLQLGMEQLGGITGIEQVWKHYLNGSGGIVQFMLELAFDLGIIKEEQNHIHIINDKLVEWLALTQSRQYDILRQWLLQLLITADIPICLIIVLLDIRRDNRWYAFAKQNHHHPLMLKLLELFSDCGYLSYCSNDEEEVFYIRSSEAVPPEYELHIQQNGEIILLPGIMPYLLWNGLEIAEVVSVQEVIMLRLTLHSLQGARRYSIDRIRSWLQGYTNGQLPLMVEQLLQIAERTEIESSANSKPDEAVDNQVNNGVLDLLSGKELENTVLFEMCSLRNWGTFCRHPLGPLQDVELASPEMLKEYYSSETQEQASLPRSWQQELRDYHLSTKQQIVDTAIRLGVCVNISTMKRCHKLVPFLLESDDEESAMHALLYREPDQPPLRIDVKSIESIQLAIE